MTLAQFADLADIFGVVLIIGSLIYVARQLHQTAEQARGSQFMRPGLAFATDSTRLFAIS